MPKKRRTKKEKLTAKKHDFKYLKPAVKKATQEVENNQGEKKDIKKPKVSSYTYKDLKSTIILAIIFTLITSLIAVISYQTDLFNSFFNLVGIEY